MGVLTWSNAFDSPSLDIFYKATENLNLQNYAFAGETTVDAFSNSDALLVVCDYTGAYVIGGSAGGVENDRATGIHAGAFGNLDPFQAAEAPDVTRYKIGGRVEMVRASGVNISVHILAVRSRSRRPRQSATTARQASAWSFRAVVGAISPPLCHCAARTVAIRARRIRKPRCVRGPGGPLRYSKLPAKTASGAVAHAASVPLLSTRSPNQSTA